MAGEAMAPSPAREFEISHKTVLYLSVPMTLAYITTPLLGLVDTAVVGRFGDAALIGGLAVGAIIFDLVFTPFNFLRSGTTGLVSQAYGAEDEKEKQAILFRALAIAILGGLLLALVSPAILWVGLWAMDPGEGVASATTTYFTIRILAMPFALGNYVILGWLIGIGKSGTTLAVQILLNGINIVLSIFLGLTLAWGIEGVAIATITGEVIAFFAGLAICWNLLDHSVRPSMARIMEVTAWKRLVNLNADIVIRSFSLMFAFGYFTSQGAAFGEVTLAANAILMHFFMIAGYFLDGLATAAEQISGRAIGARFRNGFVRGVKLTLLWSAVMAVACSLVFWLFGSYLIELMTVSSAVRSEAFVYFAWAAIIPVTGMLAFQMDGVFIGATWSRDMSLMMLVSLAGYLLIWLVVKEPMGNHGLWFALNMFVVLRGVSLATRLPVRFQKTFGN